MDGMLKLAARAHVIDELMAEAINVALPVGACDIDMLALLESRMEPCGLVSVPVKIVVSRSDGLSRNLEAARLRNALQPFAMSRGEWRKKLIGIVAGRPEAEPCCRHY